MRENNFLLQKENTLPFEAQRHCKLNLKDIKDIRKRYERGEKLSSIHKDYPQVTLTSIRYWSTEESRRADIKRRKSEKSYNTIRERKTKEYHKDLNKRRVENGLKPIGYSENFGRNDMTPLNKSQISKIKKLFEAGSSVGQIADKLNLKVTKIQSFFDNTENKWYKKILNQRKQAKANLKKQVIKAKNSGWTTGRICNKFNLTRNQLSAILYH